MKLQIASVLPPQPAQGLFGYVDSCDPDCVTGWVFNASEPNVSLPINVLIDGQLAAQGNTGLSRPDISERLGFAVNCGFRLPWNKTVLAAIAKKHSSAERFVARVFCGDLPIPPEGKFAISLTQGGAIQSTHADIGRVTSVNGPFIKGEYPIEHSLIAIISEGKVQSSCFTFRADTQSSCVFLLTVPADMYDDTHHILHVCDESGHILENGIIDLDGSVRSEVHLDRLAGGVLSGWGFRYNAPYDESLIHIFSNNRLVGSGLTCLLRQDVRELLGSPGSYGFAVSLPEDCGDLPLDTFQAVITAPSTKQYAETDTAQTSFEFKKYTVRGKIDKVTSHYCSGWALDVNSPTESLLVDVLINGCVVASVAANRPREDVNELFGVSGQHGFGYEFPCGIELADANMLQCRVRCTGDRLELASPHDGRLITGIDRLANSVAGECWRRTGTIPVGTQDISIEIVVVNRNGSEHLDRMFSSFYRHNSYSNFYFTIVDHDSSDNSCEVCQRWVQFLPIEYHNRKHNYSFSESNNWAAFHSSADTLLLLNNDTIFCQDILPAMANYVRSGADIVGIKHLNVPLALIGDNANCPEQNALFTQHLGMKFSFRRWDRSFLAYPLPLAHDYIHMINRPVSVPVVAAACLLVRRGVFLETGGFHEGYVYGQEDVEFCLAAGAKRGFQIVCANELAIYHINGASRSAVASSGNGAQSLHPHILANRALLAERVGRFLRGKRREEWLTPAGFYTGEIPRIAFVVSELAENNDEFRVAWHLGEALRVHGGVHTRYLARDSWYDLEGADAVIVLAREFDPGLIIRCVPDVVIVDWHLPQQKGVAIARNLVDAVWISGASTVTDDTVKWCKPMRGMPLGPGTSSCVVSREPQNYDYALVADNGDGRSVLPDDFHPGLLRYTCAVYGENWDRNPRLRPWWRGTRENSGQCTPRIIIVHTLDESTVSMIRAGALPITASKSLAAVFFAGLVPVFESTVGLLRILAHYLDNENIRQELAARIREQLPEVGSPVDMAAYALAKLKELGRSFRCCINVAANDYQSQELADMVRELLAARGLRWRLCTGNPQLEAIMGIGDDIRLDIGKGRFPARGDSIAAHCRLCLEQPSHLRPEWFDGYENVLLALPADSICTASPMFSDKIEFEAAITQIGWNHWRITDGELVRRKLDQWLDQLLANYRDSLAAKSLPQPQIFQNDCSNTSEPERYETANLPVIEDRNETVYFLDSDSH